MKEYHLGKIKKSTHPIKCPLHGDSRRAGWLLSSTVAPRHTSDRLRIVSRTRIESSSIDTSSASSLSFSSFRFFHRKLIFLSLKISSLNVVHRPAQCHTWSTPIADYDATITRDTVTKINRTVYNLIVVYVIKGSAWRRRGIVLRMRGCSGRGPRQNKNETEGATLRTRWPVADWTRDPRVASISMEGERTTGRDWKGGVGRAGRATRTGRKGRERTRHNERSSQAIRVSNSRVGRELILPVRELLCRRERLLGVKIPSPPVNSYYKVLYVFWERDKIRCRRSEWQLF